MRKEHKELQMLVMEARCSRIWVICKKKKEKNPRDSCGKQVSRHTKYTKKQDSGSECPHTHTHHNTIFALSLYSKESDMRFKPTLEHYSECRPQARTFFSSLSPCQDAPKALTFYRLVIRWGTQVPHACDEAWLIFKTNNSSAFDRLCLFRMALCQAIKWWI